jgi:hypothetical protein
VKLCWIDKANSSSPFLQIKRKNVKAKFKAE